MRGALYRSDDGGAHWTKVPTPTPHDLFSLWGDGRETWVAGRGGVVLRATNDTHFTSVGVGTMDPLLSITGSGRDVWVATVGGKLFHTRSHGARWEQSAVGSGDDFTAVAASPDGRVTLVGYWGTILSYQ